MTAINNGANTSRRLRIVIMGGILTTISVLLMLFGEFALPIFPGWLKIDFSAIPALIGGFSMGPLVGAAIIFLKNLIHFLFRGLGQDMGLGNIADIIALLTLVVPATLVYKYNKTRKGAIIGLLIGSAAATLMGGPLANLAVLPGYVGLYFQGAADSMFAASRATNGGVVSMWTYMLYVVVPFNLLKAVAVSLVTYAIYKPLRPVLHKFR
jgi:riboflavin transporter FmnP